MDGRSRGPIWQRIMPVTRDQAHMLAALARAIREETLGAGEWDEPGIVAAIQPHAAMTLAEVARAVTRAAEDKTAKTPGVLRDTRNPCWRERSEQRTTPRNVPAGKRCNDCGHAEEHPLHANDHPFERIRKAECDASAEVNHLRGLLRAASTEGDC